MTAKLTGMVGLSELLADLPDKIAKNIARPAMRAGVEVIADEARTLCKSSEVRPTIGTAVSARQDGTVTAKVQTKGDDAYIAPWMEHGTDPHYISIDDEERGGRTVRRINKLDRKGELVIAGRFVGKSVHHPGAKPYPFMRPALDNKLGEAIEVIGATIKARLTKEGLMAPAAPEADDE